jgi:hypothetical protein
MSAKPVRLRGQGAEAVALRLCREVYRLNAGRAIWWQNAWAVQQSLGVDAESADEAWRYARARRWIDTSHDDDIGQVMLLKAGRRIFAEENHQPAAKRRAR